MKTASLKANSFLAALLLFFASAYTASATGFLSLDADARYVNTDFRKDAFLLKTVGIVARQVIADETADRWVLYGQVEFMDDAARTDVHQMYMMFKGPMGAWNISAGRFLLPYGLLPGYSTDHAPFSALYPYTLGRESDNGLMASGTAGMFDYALAVTQGAGIFDMPVFEQGLVSGRASAAFGEAGDFTIGLSGAAGMTEISHASQTDRKRLKIGAIDFAGSVGRTVFRSEISLGKQSSKFQTAGFGGVDIALFPWAELNVAGSVVHEAQDYHHLWGFIGATITTSYLTLKGGYKNVYYGPIDHQVTLMAYKQFAFNF